MDTATQAHSASLEALSGFERQVKGYVTPERILGFLGPWIARAEFEATVSKEAFLEAFVPSSVLEAFPEWRRMQALVWAMEAMRAQKLDVDVVVRTDEVRIRWTKD